MPDYIDMSLHQVRKDSVFSVYFDISVHQIRRDPVFSVTEKVLCMASRRMTHGVLFVGFKCSYTVH